MAMTIENNFDHGGCIKGYADQLGCPEEKIVDFSASINPEGISEKLRSHLRLKMDKLHHYPDVHCTELKKIIANSHDIHADQVFVGNGSTEIIYNIVRSFRPKRVIVLDPCYSDYEKSARLEKIKVVSIGLNQCDDFEPDYEVIGSTLEKSDLFFLGHPNNPTGKLLNFNEVYNLSKNNPGVLFVIDESYLDFVTDAKSFIDLAKENIFVLKSLTKFYGIPGLRLGFGVGSITLIKELQALQHPWAVNTLAQQAGKFLLKDSQFKESNQKNTKYLKCSFIKLLDKIPELKIYKTAANFILIKIISKKISAQQLFEKLLQKKIAIRVCSNFKNLDEYHFRVSVKTSKENLQLVNELSQIFIQRRIISKINKKPAIMLQGTGSNVGKSILTAALCRILYQDGINVAPFKAQNMSLNSYVTIDSKEMGRAQALQAKACFLSPDVRMNPILLKPSGNFRSQVILNGRSIGNKDFRDYSSDKTTFFDEVKKSYDSLSQERDVLLIEGAGSPGEVNLKNRDIVNMRMANHADAKVLLIGDIDRGGTFASFIGHLEVMEKWERDLVKGFLINRFRGHKELLEDAIEYLSRNTLKNTLGVIPFIDQLNLPDEDSVSFKQNLCTKVSSLNTGIDIALINLPHISNATDFDSLLIEEDVSLHVVNNTMELGKPDVIIIPGSKNVFKDFEFLQSSGLAQSILNYAKSGLVEIVGICGGFQILGSEVIDPYKVECNIGSIKGLGLIQLVTTMAKEKTLSLTKALCSRYNCDVQGYEIHHGQTTMKNTKDLFIKESDKVVGCQNNEGLIWGTYLHGLFDNDSFRHQWLDSLLIRKRIKIKKRTSYYNLDKELDRLATIVRENINMGAIYQLLK